MIATLARWAIGGRQLLARHPRVAATLAVLALVGIGAASLYQAGRTAGRRDAEAAHFRIVRDTIVDSVRVYVEKLRTDTVRIAATVPRAEVLRQRARHELAPAESIVTHANGAPPERTTTIPTSAVLACSDAIAADSAAIEALQIALGDCGAHGRLATRRADLAEARIAEMIRERPRYGFRTGVAVGAATTTALIVLHAILK